MNLPRHNGTAVLRMRVVANIAIHRRPRHDGLVHLPPQEATVPEMMGPRYVVRVLSRAHLVHGSLLRALRVLEKGRVDLGVELLDELVVIALGHQPGKGDGVEDAAVAPGFQGGGAAGAAQRGRMRRLPVWGIPGVVGVGV